MDRPTIEQCIFNIEQYLKNTESLAGAILKYHTKYDRNSILNLLSVKKLIAKFRETGFVGDRTCRVNIEVVQSVGIQEPKFGVVDKNGKLQETLHGV